MPFFLSARRRRRRSTVLAPVAVAVAVALLPAQAFASPPDPDTADAPRENVDLVTLGEEQQVVGATRDAGLDSIRVDEPTEQTQAPAGTTTPPAPDTAPVSFGGGTTQPAALRTGGTTTATPADYVPAGALPVKLGPASDAPAPSGTWQVGVFGRTAPEAQGVDGTLLEVTAPATGSVPVSVQLSYKTYENLYGADWASRLEFVQFPECYLTTPDVEECRQYTELDTVNDPHDKTVTATVDTAADGTVSQAAAEPAAPSGSGVMQASYGRTAAAGGDSAVIGAVDSGSGPAGTFKATPLASDGEWTAGDSSGAFTWSYPLQVPPAPAGPRPQISFDYNSQAVDGKTATSSPQASWIGEGWDYDPGHIERRYRTCKDDREDNADGAPNNKDKKYKTSDLCWVSYNAVLSLGGKTTQLVRVGTTDTYRLQNDDGTRVELRTGADNGDNNGEYWVVTTTDGTQYYYGQNKVGGGHADTDSVFTVPVFGNHPGEPCHKDSFAESRCTASDGTKQQQAWHWGLDKVVDVHGNAMIVTWHKSTNYYAVDKKFKSPEKYVRGGYPETIEYGLRPGDYTTPAAKVVFDAMQRCLETDGSCASDKFDDTANPASYRPWWDSPGNLNCKSDSKLCPAFPSFWIRMRLGTVTTYAARTGVSGLARVDMYTLHQSFPRDWYNTSPGLWLDSITRTGYAPGDSTGTQLTKNGVSFGPYQVSKDDPLGSYLKDQQLPNLVPRYKGDPRPGFTRPRIGTVSTENGGDIEVVYRGGCRTEPSVDPADNHGTCYPVRWSPDAEQAKPALAWFNKYVVDSVTEIDKISGVSDRVTAKYSYSGAAWDKDDDELTKPSLRTYSVWRGYQQVATVRGAKNGGATVGVPQTQSYAATRYFRGTGGEVKDSTGTVTLTSDDAPQYAGMEAETLTYDGTGGRLLKRTLNYPWSHQTASRTRDGGLDPLLAHQVGVRRTDAVQNVDSSWQEVRTETEFDDDGLPQQVQTAVVKPDGGGEKLSDYTCSRTDYVNNEDANIIGLPKQVRVTATSCADYAGADPATQLMSATRTSYDDHAWGEVPTKGLPTSIATPDGTGVGYPVVIGRTYDPLGRPRTTTDPLKGVTETQYTPGDSGGPVTSIKTINPKGHSGVTTYDPGRGLALTVTDANGHVSRSEYDALGRLVKGWSAARSSGNQPPDVIIGYQMAAVTSSATKPSAVTVQTIKDDGGYAKQVTLYDGLGRQFQVQSEAHGPGRVIVDTHYDDHGLVRDRTGDYLAKGEPEPAQFKPRSAALVPSTTRTAYDGLERPVKTTQLHSGTAVSADSTSYGDNWTLSKPDGGAAPAMKTTTDALGRVTRIQHFTDKDLTDWRSTWYTYDARGNRTTVKDHQGNLWTYTYDARGRLVTTTDPDLGASSFEYDDLDRQTKGTDARLKTTYTSYDSIGRVTYVREGSPTAPPVKEFTYDLPGALGKPAASIRHDATGDYIDRVTGYDSEYRPTGREVVIPAHATTAGLAGTYTYEYTYTPTGKPLTVTLPSVGGLAKEKVVTRYDSDGLAQSTSGLTWYTSDVTYSPYGEPLRTVSGTQPYRVWTTNFIDEHTGHVQRTVWDRETDSSHRITDSYYSYDRAGNITSSARKLTTGATSTWDTQCFTYDYLGEMVHAWTSSVAVGTAGTGCKSASGTAWGYRQDGQPSTGPVADAPDSATDATTPDSALAASLSAAAPATGTVSTDATAYWQSFTFDAIGNRASLTEHNPADATKDVKSAYSYGTQTTGNGTTAPTLSQPHTLTKVTPTAGTGASYTYTAVGNTETRVLPGGSQSLDWNAEDKVTKVSGFGDGAGAVVGLSGKCLDNAGGSTADGNPVQLYRCNGSRAQQWKLTDDTLRTQGKCASADGTANGTKVLLASCNGSAAQKFTVRTSDKSLYNPASGKCVDVPGSNDADSTDLQLYTCNGSAAQRWTPADSTTYVYDASGNRLLEHTAAGAVLYLGETEVSADVNGNITAASRSYTQNGAPTVVRSTKYGSTTGHKLSILLSDQLGTATTSVDEASGQPLTRRFFKPFGETRGTLPFSWPNRRSYLRTGIDDTGSGLTHLGAREYDQSTGRFLSADPVIDPSDPLQINGYAYSDNNPVTKSDPDGLQPIECWEGTAVCRGGRIISMKPPAVVKPAHALTKTKVAGRDVIYDERGVPHTLGTRSTNQSEQVAFDYMNEDLRNAGKYSDGSKNGSGSQYLWQDEGGGVLQKKGLWHNANGDHVAAGATCDFIKVTWKNGKIVSVASWDANESNAAQFDADNTANTVRRKMDPQAKGQTQNVVYVAKGQAEAEAIRDRFVGNKHVRVIWPDGSFDTHRVQPLVRKIDGGTIRIIPGEATEKVPTVPDVPSEPRSGGGAKLGKTLGVFGVLGDVAMIWDATRSWQRGCDGWLMPCVTPQEA
ncbi:ricin-type beta-trefoil lectin domain protein [Streptomyces sp. NPDC058964]|uniref:ricin-type beta-trefoil lectin domain protein n=1 Tax=Streptomyces sp. NPDC058964 TaxID=3346681 RepID=UPI00367CB9B5